MLGIVLSIGATNEQMILLAVSCKMVTLQFSLRAVFIAITGCCVAAAILARFGLAGIPFSVVALAAALAWAYVYHCAPEATKYFTVFAVLGLPLFWLLIVGLLHARENSRRNQYGYTLSEIGRDYQEYANHHSDKVTKDFKNSFFQSWCADVHSHSAAKP